MKHDFTSEDVRRHLHGKNRPPLRTVKEVAEELGITVQAVSAYIRCDPFSPKPAINNRLKNVANRAVWYNHKELREWLLKKISEKSGGNK